MSDSPLEEKKKKEEEAIKLKAEREKARNNRKKEKEKKAGELLKGGKLTLAAKLFIAKFGKKEAPRKAKAEG